MHSDPPPTAADIGADQSTRPPHTKLVKRRWYWDPPDRLRHSHNLKTVSLGADQAAAWAMARALNRDHLHLGPGKPAIGSVAWVLHSFLESDKAKSLAPSTQRDYKWLTNSVLSPLPVGASTLGQFSARGIRPRHTDGIHADLLAAKGAHTAHYACRFARRVWKWAARREMVDAVNPWKDMELAGLPARTALCTPDQVAAVVAQAEARGRPSIGLATIAAYWLGHRQKDILSLTWSALDAGEVNTRKTKLKLPVNTASYTALAAALAAARTRAQEAADTAEPRRVAPAHVIINERTGLPYTSSTFQHLWREIATDAGLDASVQFRDIRAEALTELSDAGADIIAISTHGGHKTAAMARRYARPSQAQFARAAAQRVEHLDRKDKPK